MEACKVFPLHFGIDTLHKANIFESGNMCIIDCNISYLTPYHDWEKVLNLKFTGSVFDFPTNNLSLYYCAFCWANSWCFVIDISRTIHWKQFEHDPYASTENYSFLLQSSGFCLNTAFSWSGNIWSIWKCMVRSLPSSPMSYGCCLYFPFSRSDNTWFFWKCKEWSPASS